MNVNHVSIFALNIYIEETKPSVNASPKIILPHLTFVWEKGVTNYAHT